MSYLLDNRAVEQAAARFDALSAMFDPVTARHLDAMGIGAGARCWEVGAGGPGTPRELAERVGPPGEVVATDIEVGLLTGLPSTVRVLRHDVADDEPPEGGFDLVHARLVLVHLPARDEALRRMAAALRPGGWLLVEDFDMALQPLACLDALTPEQRLANRVRDGFTRLLGRRGVDPAYGRRLPGLLRARGLVDVRADAYFPVAHPAAAALEDANVRQVGPVLVEQGLVTEPELEAHLAALAAGQLDVVVPPLVSAWGRRPDRGRVSP